MAFVLDLETMRRTFKIKEDQPSIKHNTKLFKLYPYTTSGSVVKDLNTAVGDYLRLLLRLEPVKTDLAQLKDAIRKKLNVEEKDLRAYHDVIDAVFFQEEMLRPMNLRMYSYVDGDSIAERHMANYLASVLGPYPQIAGIVRDAIEREGQSNSVLEEILLDALPNMTEQSDDMEGYYSVTNVTQEMFKQDLSFILENTSRTRDYLVELLEFYYFFYTSQTCLQLNQFMQGDRDNIIPLYFSLDWEKTNRGRLCYTQGWRKILDPAIENMFVHALTLEILNQRTDSARYDYIDLTREIGGDPVADTAVVAQIQPLAQLYRKVTKQEPTQDNVLIGFTQTEREIRWLYQSIQTVLNDSGGTRLGVTGKYANKFRTFCTKHFLKNRYSSGYMLNLTESKLIFLTKLCIGKQKTMRTIEVFSELEKRGVFLDEPSKEAVRHYYERLNLIEKKSDSGDAQYVKRIL